jgi:hypothetical protein
MGMLLERTGEYEQAVEVLKRPTDFGHYHQEKPIARPKRLATFEMTTFV